MCHALGSTLEIDQGEPLNEKTGADDIHSFQHFGFTDFRLSNQAQFDQSSRVLYVSD
jgi:hypothetical protein